MRQVVIVSATRTALGSFNGSLSPCSAVDLGAIVLKEACARAGIDLNVPEEIIMGNVLQAGQLGQNTARQAAIRAGFPLKPPATPSTRCAAPA